MFASSLPSNFNSVSNKTNMNVHKVFGLTAMVIGVLIMMVAAVGWTLPWLINQDSNVSLIMVPVLVLGMAYFISVLVMTLVKHLSPKKPMVSETE